MTALDLYAGSVPTLTAPLYTITPEHILSLYHERLQSWSRPLTRMREVRDAYNGDIAVPLTDRMVKASVPNLVAQGIDQSAMRIASTVYDVRFPPDRPGFKSHEITARKRRQAALGWLEQNNIRLKQRRRARWLITYASSPVIIRPSYSSPTPRWQIRDPLATFPARTDDPDDLAPPDCIFAVNRTARYLARAYPSQYTSLKRLRTTSPDTLFTTIEYVDNEQITCILVSKAVNYDLTTMEPAAGFNYHASQDSYAGNLPYVILESIPNLTRLCPAVVPGRITLDKNQGAYDGIVGMYQTMATLFALETEAVAQGVWPDTWLIARPNETAQIVTVADGRRGIIGEVQGGDIKPFVENPGYKTTDTINRLEAYQRSTASIPAEYGGQSPSNVRTGKRGQDILSSAIDFPIQEAQEILASSAEHELKRAIATQKAYYGQLPVSFYVSWPGASGPIDYTPNDLFTSDRVLVRYSFPGTDINNLTIRVGQKLGMGVISKRSAMELDPEIEDVELELDRMNAEEIERAFWAWVQQQASQGQFTPDDIGLLSKLIITNKQDPWEAVVTVQKKAQERQASTVNPVQPGSPSAQPGLAQPGQGAEAGLAVQPPQQGPQNVADVLSTLYPAARNLNRPH
jgi:hypothetical protein